MANRVKAVLKAKGENTKFLRDLLDYFASYCNINKLNMRLENVWKIQHILKNCLEQTRQN